jgi:RNA recognition motif-containing protein
MQTKLFVGNLSYSITEMDLRNLFAGFGKVSEVTVVHDEATGRTRGFAFVTMATPEEAEAAISGLRDRPYEGRSLVVSPAHNREEQSRGGGGGHGRRGGSRGGDATG